MNEKLLEQLVRKHFSIPSDVEIEPIEIKAAVNFADAYHAEIVRANSVHDGWIRAEDRLPIEGVIVAILVGSWGNKPYTGYLDSGSWHDADGNFIGRGFNSVTHWMLLPALPKLEKIGEL